MLTNITDLRHATEQVTQNVHRLQTAEEEIRLERDRLNLIMRSVPNPIILLDIGQPADPDEPRGAAAVPGVAAGQRRGRRAQVCISNEAQLHVVRLAAAAGPGAGACPASSC